MPATHAGVTCTSESTGKMVLHAVHVMLALIVVYSVQDCEQDSAQSHAAVQL